MVFNRLLVTKLHRIPSKVSRSRSETPGHPVKGPSYKTKPGSWPGFKYQSLILFSDRPL